MASPIHARGTLLPSLNRRGSITSNRRHLVMSYAANDCERVVFQCQGSQGFLRHDHFSGTKKASGEFARKKAKGLILGFPVGELNDYHVGVPVEVRKMSFIGFLPH